eukprot:361860_1
MTLIFTIFLLLCANSHTQMSYNTNTEKIFSLTKFVGLYGDISEENNYHSQFRLRTKIIIPFDDDIKSIGKKEQIDLATISGWKTKSKNKQKKINVNIRNLSIQEVWDTRILLADFEGNQNPEKFLLSEWQNQTRHHYSKMNQRKAKSLLKRIGVLDMIHLLSLLKVNIKNYIQKKMTIIMHPTLIKTIIILILLV